MLRRRHRKQVPVFVLFYHRVSDQFTNPWSISCRDFERQIDWIEQHFEMVDLEECQRRIRSGSNTRPTLSITFDDGYAENCEFAIPMLLERRIPVTYFVTLEHTKNQQPLSHDVEAGRPLPVNTIESLRALDMSGVEIGAHTRNHINLADISDPHVILDEVIDASHELGQLIGRSIRYFAFPFGQREHLNADVFQVLRKEGFLGACTTINSWNEIGGDAFQLSRIHGDPSFSRLRNWLTFDPRLARTEKFDYESKVSQFPELPSMPMLPVPPPLDPIMDSSNAIQSE